MESRRSFIKKTTALSAFTLFNGWASAATQRDKLGDVLPLRQITRNGEKSTAFALGGYHAGIPENERDAQQIIERAVELGVRFFDNARGYHRGRSEEYYGKFLIPKYRDSVFVMSKSARKNREQVEEELDLTLKAMKVDQIDLWQMHTLTTKKDVDNRVNNGVLDAFRRRYDVQIERVVTAEENVSFKMPRILRQAMKEAS